jgi:four helix bundle protein
MTDNGSFRNLKVWHKSMDLLEEVYKVTRHFPPDERFCMTSQMRRASTSIAFNIGEGKRRKRRRAYLNHLDIALGSQGELEVAVEAAKRLTFIDQREYAALLPQVQVVGRMLNRLIDSLQPPEDW